MTSLLVIAHVGLWVAVVVQGLAICALLYKNSRLAEAAASGGVAGHDLLGASAPPFQAVDLCTGAVVSYTRFAAKPTILLFLSHACPTCQRLMRGLANARKMDELVGSVRLLAYCEGSAAA